MPDELTCRRNAHPHLACLPAELARLVLVACGGSFPADGRYRPESDGEASATLASGFAASIAYGGTWLRDT